MCSWGADWIGSKVTELWPGAGAAFDALTHELTTAFSGCGGHPPVPVDPSPEVQQKQDKLLEDALSGLAPQRPGVTDIYTVIYTPHTENGFKTEGQLVADTMRTRFDGEGHIVQLANHHSTTEKFPWAIPANLKAAIQKTAALMDADEDILMVALASHGSPGGKLEVNGWPPQAAPLVAENVKQLLDDAHVRNRVVSVSSCFSGSWAMTLANPDTLVMTASDLSHASFGCGHYTEAPFFGNAMYGQLLHDETRSFELAHQGARKLIRDREVLNGKSDGFSNPQISMGAHLKPKLDALAASLDAADH